ncbi:hypothetical protein [Aliiglaciecola sp. M165]|uniref:hypothetical protein n=1 Tax=Aliiglaciecola sp. M165 TaxID=2593649 RepID=UPI00117D748F|nr:hypothetical protein [Aliiglaciecola sp. M165]TRY29041.1 hypothetical protein FM019_19760 [Aliiglaciecola sp. M165]
MKHMTQIGVSQVSGGQGLSQFHIEEIQASNWSGGYDSGQHSKGGERLSWYLASRRFMDHFDPISVR